jgi:TolB protein
VTLRIGAVALACLLAACASDPRVEYLTKAPFEEREPAPSADALAYLAAGSGEDAFDLMVMEDFARGRPPRRLAQRVTAAPAWSPEGRRLLASVRRGEGGAEALVWIDARTGAQTGFGLDGFAGDQSAPALSPDGRRAAFAFRKAGSDDWDLVVADADGGNAKIVAPSPYREFWPRFSRDGRSLFFFSRRDTLDADDEVYRLDLDGDAVERLTRSPGHDFTPAPSPDGRFLAFASQRDGRPAVFVLRLGDGATRRISPAGFEAGHPSWSADGRRLFVTLRQEGAPADVAALPFRPF